jgi:hypothetical protein
MIKGGKMKKTFFVLFFICVAYALFAQTNKVEVSFTYTKQGGFASNQFAVWIEDAQGRHVKTLYATKFTATGGWQKREFSLPLWVKQSNLAGMNKAQIDVITGSTPKSGDLRYVWDGTNSTGKAVPAGEYRVIVEASLRNENSVIYTAAVKLGGEKGKVTAQPRYTGTSAAEQGMVGPVTVTY